MSSTDNPTEVTIFGRTYHLRGAENTAYLQELAQLVDGKMREVADLTGTADTLKVAILASLNIADECLKASSEPSAKPNAELEKSLVSMVTKLEEALAG